MGGRARRGEAGGFASFLHHAEAYINAEKLLGQLVRGDHRRAGQSQALHFRRDGNTWAGVFPSSSLMGTTCTPHQLFFLRVSNYRNGGALWVLDHGEAAYFRNITRRHNYLPAKLFCVRRRGIGVIDGDIAYPGRRHALSPRVVLA